MINLILQQHIPVRMTAVGLIYNSTNLLEQLQSVLFTTAQICDQSYLQQHISLNYNSTNLQSYLQQHKSLISLVYNSTNLRSIHLQQHKSTISLFTTVQIYNYWFVYLQQHKSMISLFTTAQTYS